MRNLVLNTNFKRHRRLRKNASIRGMVRETHLHTEDFIYPIFVIEGENIKNEVSSMPGVFQFSLDQLMDEVTEAYNLGIRSIMFFGVVSDKDEIGSGAFAEDGIVQQATKLAKEKHGDLLIIADTCLCE